MNLTKTRNTTKYLAIKELSDENKTYSISALCEFAGIARSAYYKWLGHVNSDNDNLNERIADTITKIHDEHPDMGYRRIRDTLAHDYKIAVNDKRVLRICRKKKIQSYIKHRYNCCTKPASDPAYVAENILNREFKSDMINQKYLSDDQMRVYVANLNRMETGNMKRPASGEMKSFVDWSVLRKEIVQNLPEGVIDPATQEAASYELGSHQPAALNLLGFIDTGSVAPYMLPVSSYNRLLEAAGEKQINLENDEAVFYLNPDFLGKAQEDTIALLDRIAENAQTSGNALISIDKKSVTLVPSVPMKGLTADENVKIVTALIVSDEIYHNYVDPDTCSVYWNFCIPNELVEANGLMLSVMEARDLLKPSGLYYESYLDNFGRQLFYLISGSYTTLYMGFMLLIIACALLALQFLTQMQSTKLRYLTLSILGAQREQIKRSIYKQVLWYFLLPLMLACISGTVGLYAMQQHLYSDSTKIGQSYPLLIIMAFTVVLIMAIYGVAVARTATREIGKINYKPNS